IRRGRRPAGSFGMTGIMLFRDRAAISAIGRGVRLGFLVAAVFSLSACAELWGPIHKPIDDEEYYPREFWGIFFDCSHDEHYEPGGDGPDLPNQSSPPSGGSSGGGGQPSLP